MSLSETRRHQIFPILSAVQIAIARRFALSAPQRFAAGATLFAVGENAAPAFLILDGELEIHRRDASGRESITSTHGIGEISGEVSQLAGRQSLVEGRAGSRGCEAVAYDAAHLRALLIGTAEIGEIIMRAFILRRTAYINEGGSGSVLLGRRNDPVLIHIEGFLGRNGYPFTVMDALDDGDGHALIERLGLRNEDMPIVLCPNGAVLKRPTDAQIGVCLGITPEIDPEHVYDVAVVGAGPAGLATAVYAASEGLSVLVLDAHAFGGQAGASSRIENYLGFPTGISGQALTGRAFAQAQKFGAEIAIPIAVENLHCGKKAPHPHAGFGLQLAGNRSAQARTVVIASGVRYRRPDIANLAMFEGAGVSYWASPIEASLCAGEHIALVGAGNSAGQAVVFLADKVKSLHLMVRGSDLAASMSQYLVDRIHALPNVKVHLRTEVIALSGDADNGLQGASFRNRDNGLVWTGPLRHLFLFIGADPNTDWLSDCSVALDAHGFVRTGEVLNRDSWCATERAPLPLETTVAGVFAIGDVRAGSTKRVAAAVGEGAQVVAAIHSILSKEKEKTV
ncbi:FAD-dependent oxidoreductase [Pseudolysobacter antarcticus]|uniref:FAD-dependent oxidoreductase n=1 Tax=Pseudolysobacter antarcticus TaxID=2511995 RepID=A0A411HHN7_9GAMM|nr:FAD-dependent oxidoreductase [Pseudolysobacter antarcticus]QBB70025.1 FAD-dependent oxidoreductase [Pseudolysobacter antarcticus]